MRGPFPVVVSLLLSTHLSAGLICADPTRRMTYVTSVSGTMCSVVFQEFCKMTSGGSHYSVVDVKTPVPKLQGITIDFKESKNFCVLQRIRSQDMVLCYCDTNFCSTNAALIRKLWRQSSNYNRTKDVSKCIENAKQDASINIVGEGPSCYYADDTIVRMWHKDSRCVVLLACDQHGSSYDAYYYTRHRNPSDVSNSGCFASTATRITCQCSRDFCTSDGSSYSQFREHSSLDSSSRKLLAICRSHLESDKQMYRRMSKLPPQIAKEVEDHQKAYATQMSSLLQDDDDFYDVTSATETNHRSILTSTCVVICFVIFEILII